MARSIEEIKNAMIAQKNAEPALSELTSTSATAKWNLIFYICAVAINTLETLFDVFRSEIEIRAAQIPVGTLPWYGKESLNFQYGDTLIFQDGAVKYPIIDTTKQIIKLSSANIVNKVVFIRVAKVVNNVATKLDASELAAFNAYWMEKRFAGTAISIVSEDPDKINIEYRIKYNPQLLASNGSRIGDASSFPVKDAINAFLQTFQSENFASDMMIMKLTDAIQSVSGVVNAVPVKVEAKKFDATDYTNVLTTQDQAYTSYAGYLKAESINNTYVV